MANDALDWWTSNGLNDGAPQLATDGGAAVTPYDVAPSPAALDVQAPVDPNTDPGETGVGRTVHNRPGPSGGFIDTTAPVPPAPPAPAPTTPSVPSFGTGAPAPPNFGTFAYAPFTEKFTAPTADEAANTPGYQDAIKQAQQALARSAAANGTLLTGGTAKALQQQAISYANQNYQNVFNNSLTKYNSDASQYQQGLTNALQSFALNANLSQQQYQDLLQQYGLNVNNFNTSNQLGLNYANLGAQTGLGYANLGLGYDTLNSNNTNAYNQNQLGYAGLYTGASANGAQQYGNYLTQQGNAGAAGTIGAANGYTNFLGNLGNTALYTTLLANGNLTKPTAQSGGAGAGNVLA